MWLRFAQSKTAWIVALIGLWGILNTGLYAYFVNLRGADPALVNQVESIASIALGLFSVWHLRMEFRNNREFYSTAAGPLSIIILGIVSYQTVTFGAALVMMAISAWLIVRFVEGDIIPFDWRLWSAVFAAQFATLVPAWGWYLEGSSEGLAAFALPLGFALAAFAIAVRLVTLPASRSLDDAFNRGINTPGTL